MKKFSLLTVAMACASVVFYSCGDDGPAPDNRPPAEHILMGGAAVASGDTVYVAYQNETDLSELFSYEPAGTRGTFVFSVSEQPSYSSIPETDGVMTGCGTVYAVNGNALVSLPGKRVPDVLVAYDEAAAGYQPEARKNDRTVMEGELNVKLMDGATLIEQVDLTIVQTGKPALEPVIGFAGLEAESTSTLTDGPVADSKLLTMWQNTSTTQRLNDLFTISPIDFDFYTTRIEVRPVDTGATAFSWSKTASATAYSFNSGSALADGTQYVYAFYNDDLRIIDTDPATDGNQTETNTVYDARIADKIAAAAQTGARLYVKVNEDPVTGVVAHPSPTASWTAGGTPGKIATQFVQVKLQSGRLVNYSSSTHGALGAALVGNMSGVFAARVAHNADTGLITTFTKATENGTYPGWWQAGTLYVSTIQANEAAVGSVAVLPQTGAEYLFTVKFVNHFSDANYTAIVSSTVKPAAAERR